MNKVIIVPTEEGNLVTPYAGNSDYGYVMLSQTKPTFQNGWLKDVVNRTIIKGSVEALKGFVQSCQNLEVDGNLVVQEYLEGNVPESIAKAHFDESLSYEEQIDSYIKRAGKEGPALMVDDKKILRFVVWDVTSNMKDITLQHTNTAEVKAYNDAKVNAEDASLD